MIARLIWQWRYARMALRSPYDFNILSAWSEAAASWDMWNVERGNEPMPTSGQAIYEDQFEWYSR